jgi:hypothetical protein
MWILACVLPDNERDHDNGLVGLLLSAETSIRGQCALTLTNVTQDSSDNNPKREPAFDKGLL